jgi:small subunit ribosomal protein S16
MVVIRLSRGGAKARPFYNIVVADKRNRRDGRFIERIGFYNPLAKGGEEPLRIAMDRLTYWTGVGAEPSDTVARLVKQALPRPPPEPSGFPGQAGEPSPTLRRSSRPVCRPMPSSSARAGGLGHQGLGPHPAPQRRHRGAVCFPLVSAAARSPLRARLFGFCRASRWSCQEAEIKIHADGIVARIEGMDDRNAGRGAQGRAHLPAAQRFSRPLPRASTTGST